MELSGIVVGAALLSAMLHAGWNAAVKAAPDPHSAMVAQVVGGGLLALPLLFFVPLPTWGAVPWLAGSALFNFLTLSTLLRGYASGGGFGLVYPLSRAVAPLLVLLAARGLQGEAVSMTGVFGIMLVSGAVALFTVGEARALRSALGWALLAGVFSAAYALCDGNGARVSPSVLGYGLVMSVINAAVFGATYALRTRVSPVQAIRDNIGIATLASAASNLSYFLILWVWTMAPIAVGSALRDTSVVFAAIIATVMGEKLTGRRVAAILLAAAGAAIIRFA